MRFQCMGDARSLCQHPCPDGLLSLLFTTMIIIIISSSSTTTTTTTIVIIHVVMICICIIIIMIIGFELDCFLLAACPESKQMPGLSRGLSRPGSWALQFIPMPMPQNVLQTQTVPAASTDVFYKLSRASGMGMNVTAQKPSRALQTRTPRQGSAGLSKRGETNIIDYTHML